jgi:murein L,D-transpeptidase YafK
MKNIRIFILAGLTIACFFTMAFAPPGTGKRHSSKKTTATKKVSDTTSNPYYIIIDKSTYELKVYDDQGWYATYPVVFGSKDLSDKMQEGDKRTPDGHFKVVLKKVNPNWGQELLLDYPNPDSYEKFNERKAKGILPKMPGSEAVSPFMQQGLQKNGQWIIIITGRMDVSLLNIQK